MTITIQLPNAVKTLIEDQGVTVEQYVENQFIQPLVSQYTEKNLPKVIEQAKTQFNQTVAQATSQIQITVQ